MDGALYYTPALSKNPVLECFLQQLQIPRAVWSSQSANVNWI